MSAPCQCLASPDHTVWHCCDCVLFPGTVPLELAAAKSRSGHAETGAGAVGIRAATMRLSCLGQLPLAHLRSPNTHVAQALDTAKAAQWFAPRELAGGFEGGSVACVSAFAFQGTNAHAVLCRTALVTREPGGTSSLLLICSSSSHERTLLHVSYDAGERDEPCWKRQRLWYAPQPHGLLQSTLSASGSTDMVMEAALDQPALSYLWDHKVMCLVALLGCFMTSARLRCLLKLWYPSQGAVTHMQKQVAGRLLLPGAGMFEAALGACNVLADGGITSAPSLTRVSIPAALQLPVPQV